MVPTEFLSDKVANLFLAFSHIEVVVPFLMMGYIWLDKKLFLQTAYLALSAVIVNYALKVTFMIPSHIPSVLAYPSGHMQFSVSLYGYLITQIKKPLYQTIMIVMLFGIASSLVHFNYHNYFDVVGSIFFAALFIVGYIALSNINQKALLPLLTLLISTLLVFYIAVVYDVTFYVWRSYYGLLGIIVSEHYFGAKVEAMHKAKIMATLSCFIVFVVAQKIFVKMVMLPIFLSQIQWLVIGAFLPFALHQSVKLEKRFLS